MSDEDRLKLFVRDGLAVKRALIVDNDITSLLTRSFLYVKIHVTRFILYVQRQPHFSRSGTVLYSAPKKIKTKKREKDLVKGA